MPASPSPVAVADRFQVIDVDTHVLEPDDVWTSRVSSKWGDLVPHVRRDPQTGAEFWYAGDEVISGIRGLYAAAGWREPLPSHPPNIDEIDPAAWNPSERLKRMDEYGIHAQVLYPNVGWFSSGFLKLRETELMRECARAYNDFLVDWCSIAPGRLIPVMTVPFWDSIETIIGEVRRSAANGHRGIVFTNKTHTFGLPLLADHHWDPLWAVCQDLGLTVNFHIGGGSGESRDPMCETNGARANFAKSTVMEFMDNAKAIADITISGMCHRFPDLNFVSVESGIGYMPYLLEGLDWQWVNGGGMLEHPDYDLLPSEYFRRQIYGCFWFERQSAETAINLYPDNMLYETDFPHPTSMSPGPSMPYAINPREYMERTLGGLPEPLLRKVLHDNAARIYHLD